MHKYIHNVTKVMCALYVRCALSILQKECRKVWGARYTLGVCYRSENTVSCSKIFFIILNTVHSVTCDPKQLPFFLIANKAVILCNTVTYLIPKALSNGD